MATTAPNQHTLLVRELEVGRIYRDALSGYLVLVQEVEIKELQHGVYPGGGKWSRTVPVKRRVGLYWNPVFGAHKELQLHDHQLIDADRPTALKPDTRYDRGLHG